MSKAFYSSMTYRLYDADLRRANQFYGLEYNSKFKRSVTFIENGFTSKTQRNKHLRMVCRSLEWTKSLVSFSNFIKDVLQFQFDQIFFM